MIRFAPQRSAAPYLTALAIGVVLERWASYLWFEIPIVWGQAANILVIFASFAVAVALWLPARQPESRSLSATWFLGLMGAAWLVHLALYRFHGEAFNYTALLYLPILIMLWIKPPNVREGWQATIAFAWAASIMIVVTRVLEMTGLLAAKAQPAKIVAFDESRYFLPLNDFLGIEGRWPGPFGHNGDTALIAALLIVVACACWTRASWVFLTIGILTLVVTNGRAAIGASLAGLVLLVMFTKADPIARIPRLLRATVGTTLLIVGGLVMFARPAGLTGRNNIWPAFLDLWATSPWLGVGGIGIATGNDITREFGHAHSLYIDELVRWGIVGFVSQFAALALGIYLALRAAGIGSPGSLSVVTTYLISGVTEPRNNWIAPSTTGFLVIIMVMIAAAAIEARPNRLAASSAGPESTAQKRSTRLFMR